MDRDLAEIKRLYVATSIHDRRIGDLSAAQYAAVLLTVHQRGA